MSSHAKFPDGINIDDWPSQEWIEVVADKGGLEITAKDGTEYTIYIKKSEATEQEEQ